MHKFPYNWTLKDAVFTKDKGKVFSCFACGGGSTMGYKLSGFDVLGCNEIDPKMMEAYIANHNPKFSFLEPIQTFKLRKDLPKDLYDLDILDGSPPCSSFSMVGNREKDWCKAKVFREGQSMQVLDTLFFDFIDLAKELKPKIVIAENVEGLLLGNAKSYVIEIYKEFDRAGYYCQHFLLNSNAMGVPQSRKRVFFICLRKDLADKFLYQQDMFTYLPKLDLHFNEPKIKFESIIDHSDKENQLSELYKSIWDNKIYGDTDFRAPNSRMGRNKNTGFSHNFIYQHKVANTQVSDDKNILFDYPRYLNRNEVIKIGSFPSDYDYDKITYLIGMSVPPVMTAQIASRIYEQWLSKI